MDGSNERHITHVTNVALESLDRQPQPLPGRPTGT